MSSGEEASGQAAPSGPGADGAGGAKPIAEALQRLVMTSGASRRHVTRVAARSGTRRAPGLSLVPLAPPPR
jgi:hypothetical protein